MRIEVDLQGANAATVIPQLQALLFFPSLGAAMKSLPEFVADMLPFPIDVKYQPACHCFHVLSRWKVDPRLILAARISSAPVNI